MSVEALQRQIIHKIMNLDAAQLQEIDATLERYAPTNAVIDALDKPMRDKLDIEQLKKEQGFKPINKVEFFQKIDELNIEEPLEDLLAMI